MRFDSRIRKIEELVGAKDPDCPVVSIRPPRDECTIPHFSEPQDQWTTFKTALDEARRDSVPCVFLADPYKEYEARHGLEPGMLSKHELRGKVPFAELLEKTTGRAQAPDETERNWTV